MLSWRSTRVPNAFWNHSNESREEAEAHRLIKILEYLVVLVYNIISCRIRVASIKQTPTRDLSSTRSMIYFKCQNSLPTLLPCPAVFSMTAVTPCVLPQRNVNGFGNPIQASLNGNLVQMTARMKIQQLQIQLFATLHFIQKAVRLFSSPSSSGCPKFIR